MESQWQIREMRREKILKEALRQADLVIMEGSDGSEEELNYLTARLAKQFMEKAFYPFQSELMKKDMLTDRLIRAGEAIVRNEVRS